MRLAMSSLFHFSRRVPFMSFMRLTRSCVVPSKLLSIPFLAPSHACPRKLTTINGSKSVGLTVDQIEKFKSVTDVLAAWHEQDKTVTPAITLKCLIEATNLVRRSRDFKTLSSPVFKQLLQASVDSAGSLGPEEVVTLLWVIAKIKWVNFEAIMKLVNIVRKDIHRLSDKSIGLIPWALVTLKIADTYKQLVNRIVNEVCHRLERGVFKDDRALANICWSLSSAKQWPAYFTPHVEAFLRTQGHSMSAHTLSMFLHAMSRAGVLKSEEWLFNVISDGANRLKDTDPQSLTLILWSIGNQKVYNKRLFNELEEVILSGELVKQYTPRIIATLIWSCARTQYYSKPLLKYLSEQVPCFIDKMTVQDLGMVAYSFAFLNYPCPDLIRSIAARVLSLDAVKPVDFQVLLNLSWACLINEVYIETLFELCMSWKIIKRIYVDKHKTLNHVHQLLQLDLACRFEQPSKGLPLLSPHDRLQMLINAAAFVKEKSKFQQNVAKILADMYGCVYYLNMETFSITGYGLDFELLFDSENRPMPIPARYREFSAEAVKEFYEKMTRLDSSKGQGLDLKKLQIESGKKYNLSADWFVQDSHVQRQIAIEVDGPVHFAANCHHPLGRTVLKTRQLKAVGWDVISIPYFEWSKFEFNEMNEMKEYLAKKLVPKQ